MFLNGNILIFHKSQYIANNFANNNVQADYLMYWDFNNDGYIDHTSVIVATNNGDIIYNNGHPVTNIILHPENSFTLDQFILVKSENETEDDILELFKQGQIRLTYFTGNFNYYRGHGYKGLGKKTDVYAIYDLTQDKLGTQ